MVTMVAAGFADVGGVGLYLPYPGLYVGLFAGTGDAPTTGFGHRGSKLPLPK
jgi:hypothetical protein